MSNVVLVSDSPIDNQLIEEEKTAIAQNTVPLAIASPSQSNADDGTPTTPKKQRRKEQLLTIRQVGERLGQIRVDGIKKSFCPSHVTKLIHTGRLKAHKNEFGFYLIKSHDLEQFIEKDYLVPKSRGRNARKIRERVQAL